jgi:hypothetical protein
VSPFFLPLANPFPHSSGRSSGAPNEVAIKAVNFILLCRL